jgi:stage II sporulation protein D
MGDDLRSGTVKLPNEIKLHDDKGFFHLIGLIQERDYLVGVLSNEIPLSWPMESLTAQAVAARSYARARSRESNSEPHHLVATTMDQVFSFPDYENDKNLVRALTAVEATKDVVLKDPENARVIKAFYHSDCGGMTLPSATVFGSGKDYGSTQDKSCSANPNSRWNYRLDEKNQKILAQKLGIKQSKNLIFYQVNAGLLRVGNSVGELKDVWIQKFREILGFDKVRSLKFTIAKDELGLVLEGKGFGHGVGMCQWGAKKLGDEGATYQKILSHYYPKAKISKTIVAIGSANSDGPIQNR